MNINMTRLVKDAALEAGPAQGLPVQPGDGGNAHVRQRQPVVGLHAHAAGFKLSSLIVLMIMSAQVQRVPKGVCRMLDQEDTREERCARKVYALAHALPWRTAPAAAWSCQAPAGQVLCRRCAPVTPGGTSCGLSGRPACPALP